jgi:hypothetical protein
MSSCNKDGLRYPMLSRRDLRICILFLITIIFLPYGYAEAFGLGSPDLIVAGLFWEYVVSFYYTGFRLLPLTQVLSSSVFWFFRFIFLAQLYLYYDKGRNFSRMSVILVGILAELIPLLVSLPYLLNFTAWPVPLYNYVIPVPILLLLGAVLVLVFPKEQQEGIW